MPAARRVCARIRQAWASGAGASQASAGASASRPPRLRHSRARLAVAFAVAPRPPAAVSARSHSAADWAWTRVPPRHARGIGASAPMRAEAEGDDEALQWSGAFDGRLKMIMMEAAALDRELCENPAPDRQAVIGKSLARTERARALGKELLGRYDEIKGLQEVVNDFKEDASTREVFRAEADEVQERIRHLQRELIRELLPRDVDDDLGVVLEVRAAAGGDEASLFAAEVFEMYKKLSERKGWKFEVMSTSPSDAGGVKEAVGVVSGERVYGFLKFESGVHRVQRVPVTEGAGRVHTSTVSVAVMPDGETAEFKLDERDIKIEVMRASGAGGQSVNTTESAVRMTHLPTGDAERRRERENEIDR